MASSLDVSPFGANVSSATEDTMKTTKPTATTPDAPRIEWVGGDHGIYALSEGRRTRFAIYATSRGWRVGYHGRTCVGAEAMPSLESAQEYVAAQLAGAHPTIGSASAAEQSDR